jgi:hypothetical protein
MSLFIRQSRSGDWRAIDRNTSEDMNFPADVLWDVLDRDRETSVWQFENLDEPEFHRLVAALNPRNTEQLVDMTFRAISDQQIEQIALEKRQTRGGTLDDELNKSSRHWIIKVNTVGEAIRLAKALSEHPPITFNQDEVMCKFASSLQGKFINAERVTPKLFKRLIDGGHLRIIMA